MKSSANDVSELMVARLLRIGSKLTKWHLFQFSITYWGISKFENSFRILFIWQLVVLLRVTGWKKSRGFRVSPKKYSNVMVSVQKKFLRINLTLMVYWSQRSSPFLQALLVCLGQERKSHCVYSWFSKFAVQPLSYKYLPHDQAFFVQAKLCAFYVLTQCYQVDDDFLCILFHRKAFPNTHDASLHLENLSSMFLQLHR